MKKGKTILKFISAVLAFSLVLSLAPLVSAMAATAFSDISETDYYYTEVTAMSSQGVINGYGDGTFLPQNYVKNSEALKLVCLMAGVSYSGYSGKTDPWYSDVFTWAQDNGVVASGTDPNAYATREQICNYIVAIYKLPANTNTNAFSDTTSKTANTLYDYGVIKGIPNADGTVSFGGGQNVKRCDTCIMLYRLNQQVEKPVWAETFSLDRSHYSISKPTSYTTYDDYVKAWSYMLVNARFKETFQANITCTKAQLQDITTDIQNAYYFAMFDYMEYASFLNQWSVSVSYYVSSNGNCMNPKFTLELSNSFGLSQSEVAGEIASFNSACANMVTSLYKSGSLRSGMTEKEKAHVLYVFMAYNTKYDTNSKYYTGYDAAVRGTAVCQGYTAMYAYLCNLAGVRMESMTGDAGGTGHAWNRINSNGTYYNVDTTWADPVPDQPNYCDEDWFWVTDKYLKTCSKPRTFDSDTYVYG